MASPVHCTYATNKDWLKWSLKVNVCMETACRLHCIITVQAHFEPVAKGQGLQAAGRHDMRGRLWLIL
jgi:hypothetical protein